MSQSAPDMVRQRQDPLRKRYREAPDEAWITDRATAASGGCDPFHGRVVVGDTREERSFGIHRAIGGDHDLPNPGDMLCASLAACLDSTVRMLASRMGVRLQSLEVAVTAHADVRGCLMVERGVPVGFQRIEVDVQLKAADAHTDPALVAELASRAEQCCVILQTLRGDLPVTTRLSRPAGATAAPGSA